MEKKWRRKACERSFAETAGDPVNFVDLDGREILKFQAEYNMSDYSALLGNEPEDGVKISQEGCYITTIANLLYTALVKYGKRFTEKDYTHPEKINDDKSLFQSNSGLLNYNAMNILFGEENYDYWTKAKQGSADALLERLASYEKCAEGYMIVGIFDLTSVNDLVPNHMVGINAMPNADGVFEDIVPTSNGDAFRLANEEMKKAYCLDNLKEFRVVKITDKLK